MNSLWRISHTAWTCFLVEDAEERHLVHIWTWIMIFAVCSAFISPLGGWIANRFGLIPAVRGLFLFGYLLVWTGFSMAATLIQWGMHSAMLISPAMVGTSRLLGGAVLVAAGAYQLTPAKHACLSHCRSPLGFLLNEWRDGAWGALAMGLRHGLYCTGCCWLLMAVLFVVGVMNLLWIALLAAFVLLEKAVPQGRWISHGTGLALIACGAWMARGVMA